MVKAKSGVQKKRQQHKNVNSPCSRVNESSKNGRSYKKESVRPLPPVKKGIDSK